MHLNPIVSSPAPARFMLRTVFGLLVSIVLLSALHAPGQTVILREDFEGVFPGDWIVGDANFDGDDAYWDDVYLPLFGSPPVRTTWAGYCAGTGYGGSQFSPEYQDEMLGIMAKTIDLRGYSSATLTFWDIVPSIETDVDFCRVLIDQTRVYYRDFPLASWTQQTIDLTPYVGATHTLSFQFVSDFSVTFEGWYLDDIVVTGVGSVSPPQLTNPAWSQGNFTVSLSTLTGFTYYLEATDTLNPISWTTVQTAPGTGGVIQLSDSTASPQSRFYRVRVQ
jgi:hypothetical protein